MRVRMKATAAGPAGSFLSGYEYGEDEMPPELMAVFIDAKAAEEIAEPVTAPPVAEPPAPETATKKIKKEKRGGERGSPPTPPTPPESVDEDDTDSEDVDEVDEAETLKAWPLKMDVDRYLSQFGEDAKYGRLATEIIALRDITEA